VILLVSAVDIKTRVVGPLVIGPLAGLVFGGWTVGWWDLSWIGGLLALTGCWFAKLPLGDAFAFGLVGMLVGPDVALAALALSLAALCFLLCCFGESVNLVRHPFFPYLGAMTLAIFSIRLSNLFS
jgi:hypothetical protein